MEELDINLIFNDNKVNSLLTNKGFVKTRESLDSVDLHLKLFIVKKLGKSDDIYELETDLNELTEMLMGNNLVVNYTNTKELKNVTDWCNSEREFSEKLNKRISQFSHLIPHWIWGMYWTSRFQPDTGRDYALSLIKELNRVAENPEKVEFDFSNCTSFFERAKVKGPVKLLPGRSKFNNLDTTVDSWIEERKSTTNSNSEKTKLKSEDKNKVKDQKPQSRNVKEETHKHAKKKQKIEEYPLLPRGGQAYFKQPAEFKVAEGYEWCTKCGISHKSGNEFHWFNNQGKLIKNLDYKAKRLGLLADRYLSNAKQTNVKVSSGNDS